MSEILLCVNLDHIATLRQARKGSEPDLGEAVLTAQAGGADGITVHLREDRRHMQDADLPVVKELSRGRFTLEVAPTPEMLQIARMYQPDLLTLVPEKRAELTTEGGLDVLSQSGDLSSFLNLVMEAGLQASLFIDPDPDQIEQAKKIGAKRIELHTGIYANATTEERKLFELGRLKQAALYAHSQGFIVNAGHGLNRHNLKPILSIPHLRELHIGHAIVARAIILGLHDAVCEIKSLIQEETK